GVMHDDLGFLLSDLLCNVSLGSKVILTAPSDITIGNMDPYPCQDDITVTSILANKPYDQAYVPNLSEILKGLICLRALNLVAVNSEKLLRSFGEHIKDLRYLKLGISSKCLPDSIIGLKNCKPWISGSLAYLIAKRFSQIEEFEALVYWRYEPDEFVIGHMQSPSGTLRKLEIISITRLDQTLSISKLNVLESLSIKRCPELTKLVLESLFSLKRLEIHECDNLEHITCAQAQLPSVETLEIKDCEKLALIKDSRTRDRECFNNLRFLKLINILNLKSLEIGLCSLEKLEELSLYSIYELRALPKWIGNIKQLHQLAIRKCPFLLTLPESLGKLAMLQKR
ncbi:hypothetical protein RDABS01_039908, partial [Bienertia sinuspersici]